LGNERKNQKKKKRGTRRESGRWRKEKKEQLGYPEKRKNRL
jgi:hypothetical protein